MKRKNIILILTLALILLTTTVYAEETKSDPQKVELLIIHSKDSKEYLDIYQNYKQSLIPNLEVSLLDIDRENPWELEKYKGIYLDPNIIGKEKFNLHKVEIIDYVNNGGHIFLEDNFHEEFPLDFIGAYSFKELEVFPKEITAPKVGEDLQGTQELVKLFHRDIKKYYHENTLNSLNKGWGFVNKDAIPLIKHGDLTLYALNNYGKGSVLFSNSMLPNDNYITGFDFKSKKKGQEAFSFTFATGNYLMRNEFPTYISKREHGYSVKKVLGTYGRPAMAWQNHFEVGSALEDKSMEKWIDVLKEYNQIPSYSLARSLYEWGHWQESVVVHKNIGSKENAKFTGEEENSHYSSGRHLKTTSGYLALENYPEKKDLSSKLDLPYRAYPSVGYFDDDGVQDIISGSKDGYIYFFKGISGYEYEEKTRLKLTNGEDIHVGSYSTPVLIDIDGDKKLDIIVGSGDGKIYQFLNNGDNTFKTGQLILENKGLNNTTPTMADLNGNGVYDLIFGESEGNIHFHRGNKVNESINFDKKGITLKQDGKVASVGAFPAPSVVDLDNTGSLDLIIGDQSGYLKRYKVDFPNIKYKELLQGETLNPKGDRRIWGGYYSVPTFRDIDLDGIVDLVVGQVEFGLPTPIDHKSFPYKEELKTSLKVAKDNYIDIYPHIYFHPYKNSNQELRELELHKAAFAEYGIPWENTGTNQHTWNINNLHPDQSFLNEKKSGIAWNSGFRPSLKAGEPSLSRDYIWAMPFKLGRDEKVEDFTLFSPAPNIPILEGAYDSLSSLNLPISYFYHMEYGVNKEGELNSLKQKAKKLDEIRNKAEYNFMTETQMFKAFQANIGADINIKENVTVDSYEFQIDTKFMKGKDPYNKVVGIEFEPGEKYKKSEFRTDADIYHIDGRKIYIGLKDKNRVYISKEVHKPHIVRVNGPIEVKQDEEEENTLKLELQYSGLQQIKIYAPKGIEVDNKEFEIKSQGDYIILNRYGEGIELQIKLD